MPTNIWLGTSIPNNKVVTLTAGSNISSSTVFTVGLGTSLFTFTGWNPTAIASTWNASANPLIKAVSASVSGNSVIFTANTSGDDFEITCSLVNSVTNIASTYQTLTFGPQPSGGTFTITVAGLTTGNISYNATPATFAASMQTAIAALSGFGSTDVLVSYLSSPQSFLFDFSQGRFAGTNVTAITATHTSLTGGNASIVVSHVSVGNAGTSQEDELTFPLAGTHTGLLNETQTLTTNATKGTFTLTVPGYGTTAAIAFSAGRSVVQSVLEQLVGIGNVLVTDGPLYWAPTNQYLPLTVQFTGTLAGKDIPQMTATVVSGGTDEQQLLTMGGSPTSGTFTLSFGGQTTSALAYTATAAQVQTALLALSSIGAGNITVAGSAFTTVTVTTSASNEQQQILLTGSPISGHYKLTFGGQTTGFLNYTDSASTVRAALEALSSIGTGNIAVTDGPLLTITGPTGAQSEIQTLKLTSNPTSGTFTLSFNGSTTTSLAFTASAATIQTALQALSSIGSSNILCTGSNLSALASGTNEVQRLTVSGSPTSGTFTLSFGGQTSAAIAFNATAATIQTAVQAMTSIGSGNASVSGGPLASGPSGATNEVQLISAPSAGASTVGVAAVDNTFTLSFGGQTTGTLDWTASAATIQTALQGLSSIGAGNAVVTGGPLVTVGGPTGGNDAVQVVHGTIGGTLGTGTNHYTLTLAGHTTASIDYAATDATVQTAIRLLAGLSLATVTWSGAGSNNIINGSFFIDFGSVGPQSLITADFTAMNGATFSATNYATGTNPTWTYSYNGATVTFQGALAGHSEALITSTAVSGSAATISRTTAGSAGTYSYSTVDITFQGTLGSAPQSLFVSSGIVGVTEVTIGSATYTYNTVTMTFAGSLATSPQSLITSAGISTSIVETQAGSAGTYSYGYTDLGLTFQGSLGSAAQALVTSSAATGGGVVTITETNHGNAAVSSYVYGSMTAHFQGTLAGTAEALITATTVTGSPLPVITEVVHGGPPTYTVMTSQNGGISTIQNISGGTFGLNIQGTVVLGIPYNVTAVALAAQINAVFGSNVVTCTGGPAPYIALFLFFQGSLQNQPVTVSFINALTTNTDGSVEKTVVLHGAPDPVGVNVWDLVVSPGNGTLGVNSASANAQLWITITNNLTALAGGASMTPAGQIYIPLISISALVIQTAINEALAFDACRVVQIGRSQEWANINVPAGGTGHGGTSGQPQQWTDIWYMQDTYRITFLNQFAASGSVTLTATFPLISGVAALPSDFMKAAVLTENTGDPLDFFSEEQRVVIGFNVMQAASTPLHLCSIGAASVKTQSQVGWRFKLQTQYTDNVGLHTGLANYPSSGQIQFVWNKKAVDSSGTATYTALASSVIVDWNSPASVIQTVISNMFFGLGNVKVTGGLGYSWLSETLLDAPGVHYQDLKVFLTGQLFGLPIDEFEYDLTCVISGPQFDNNSTFQKNFRVVSDYCSRSLPPHFNKREHVKITGLANPVTLSLGLGNSLVTVPQTSTAAQVQTALDGLYGNLPTVLSTQINGVPLFPPKLAHPVFVYGTTFVDGPMDFEFNSFGLQASDTVEIIVSSTPQNTTVANLITIVQGVSTQDDIQLVTIAGGPYAGTYTLSWGGNTTSAIAYNASLSTLQAALAAASPSAIVATSVSGNSTIGFTFDWAASGGPRALITDTVSMSNVGLSIVVSNVGGTGASFTAVETVKGRGPNYADDFNNWSLGRCLNSGDTSVFDDSPSPMTFGINMSSVFTVTSLSPSAFAHTRSRQVFDANQAVTLTGTGTAPSGLTFGTTYLITSPDAAGNFKLSSLMGAPITITTVGSGVFTLVVASLVVQVYSRFAGQQVGLPHLRDGTSLEYLPNYWKALFTSVDVGIGEGDGLTLGRFDTMTGASSLLVEFTGSSSLSPINAVLFLANNTGTNLTINNGDVGLSLYAEESSTFGSVTILQGSLAMSNASIQTLNKGPDATVTMQNSTAAHTINIS